MLRRLRSIGLFALYQIIIVTGIVLLPFGMVATRMGVPFPFQRLLRLCAPSEATTDGR
ncbi:hypothetical protein [Halocatena halophila]|uniref:hypothetical protein n=1 Tax=Halocatena halophila TaxID=2814576 RepID=UPI002ED4B55D